MHQSAKDERNDNKEHASDGKEVVHIHLADVAALSVHVRALRTVQDVHPVLHKRVARKRCVHQLP